MANASTETPAKMARVNIHIPPDIWEAAQIRAVKEKRSAGKVTADALSMYLAAIENEYDDEIEGAAK